MREASAPGVGEAIRRKRELLQLRQEDLAHQLNLPVQLLDAIEREDWEGVPPGRGRPLVRQLMERLGIDPTIYTDAWEKLPGGLEQEAPDPKKDLWERVLMGGISLAALALVLWLILPGPNIKRGIQEDRPTRADLPWTPQAPPSPSPFPVLGELIPEAGVTAEGVLVSLRTLDTCEARLQGPQTDQTRTLRVSEPWKLRVPGPFTLTLSNSGVVEVEVAGRRIRHPGEVGESWTGQFGGDGQAILPQPSPSEVPPTAPETDEETSPTPEGTE
ncbi:helix-turn-helix domain-containing protein [Holophaga foetida]|uniref:helix-turn-helix domain-containing protein n=1 Tax=Holophaga foetida TaxID=35839 RepID=UPI0002475359|nr:helix-turn-helix domain-containing protein [Holophaga foetida]